VFLEASGKLNPNQHGFRQKHSCQTQLLETVHQWAITINAGQSTHAVFIDFSKAFDTVPHERLLLKLDHVGIRGPLERDQRVLDQPQTASMDQWLLLRLEESTIRCATGINSWATPLLGIH